VPVWMTTAPRWFRVGLGLFLVLAAVHLFAGEALALYAVWAETETDATAYFVPGALVIGGIVVLLPLIDQGLRLALETHERQWAERPMREVFAAAGGALVVYTIVGLVVAV
jgi:hypothetical protein